METVFLQYFVFRLENKPAKKQKQNQVDTEPFKRVIVLICDFFLCTLIFLTHCTLSRAATKQTKKSIWQMDEILIAENIST
jgi:hypothetical protein